MTDVSNSDDAVKFDAAMDRRLEQLLILILVNSLRRREDDGAADDNLRGTAAKDEDVSLDDQSAISRELMIVAQRLIDAQLLDLWRDEDMTHNMPSPPALKKTLQSSLSSVSPDKQLMDDDDEAAAIKKKKSAAAANKKKRYRKNKAAAKRRKTGRVLWLKGAGILPQIIMMALGSITTLIVYLAIIHQRVDGSSEGGAPPALPPTASKSLLRRSAQLIQHQPANAAASTVSKPDVKNSVSISDIPPPFLLSTNSPRDSEDTSIFSSRQQKQQTCLDTPKWKDRDGVGCDSYEEWDDPGCPHYGDLGGDMGSALENCCYCGGGSATLPPTISPTSAFPTLSFSPTDFCLDTPNWKDMNGSPCDVYGGVTDPGCAVHGDLHAGDMGSARENCCQCGGGVRTCEDYRSTCQNYFSDVGVEGGKLTEFCKRAESCSCDGTNHDFKIFATKINFYTVDLYDECKCDYWLHLCEDSGEGVACDYAAEYCCGDYAEDVWEQFWSRNSPVCYCDFINYARDEFHHTLRTKALNNFNTTGPSCRKWEAGWLSGYNEEEALKGSLTAIFENTSGQNWFNNSGWMNDTIPFCQWHGISCNGDGKIICINLRNNNLQGQFPLYTYDVRYYDGSPDYLWSLPWVYAKYGLANLLYLETLDLAENHLTGRIDYRPLYNLESLHHFDISGNQLSGGFDPLITPSISYANFSNNLFTSMHRFQPYKVSPLQTIRSVDVSNNEIKINATDLFKTVPPNIEQFLALKNYMYRKLPASLNNLPKLRRLDMSFNALSGELPVFENSRFVLQELDLSNQDQANGLTGSIPEQIWRFQSLKILNLAGNKLIGTLPPDIVNLAVIQSLNLSGNRLSGEIPPQIGQLDGNLNYLSLAENNFIGTVPFQLGELEDASVHLKDNLFDISTVSPLSLCTLVRVKYSDLANDTHFCPIERTALSNFYDSAKGGEWTNSTNWNDEYTNACLWYGVECDKDDQVTELNLNNNGLSGRLSSSIGRLTSLTKLDLSDNDIKGSIPTEIGLLNKLKYLRLSYNALTGTAPDILINLINLKLLQLQSNRITDMPNLPKYDDSYYSESTFVTDCGVPSAFENALECENCTMCCNANEDCYPQEETLVEELGLNYSSFSVVILVSFTLLCCIVIFFISRFYKHQESTSTLTMSMQEKIEQDDNYALSRIGSDSVYSYFVTDLRFGWFCAFATLAAQAGILVFFVQASEANLQDDKTDIEFTWKCPRDTERCSNKSDLGNVGWFFFCLLMVAFLAKDLINGSKLIYYSSKARHKFWSRIRYFIGGLTLCTITLYALYVSTVYSLAIATSNTDIILNSVVVLFIMDMDEVIFAAIEAWNEKWIKHANGSEDEKEQIASQQEEINGLRDEITFLREAVQELKALQPTTSSTSESVPQCAEGIPYDKASEAGETATNDGVVTIPFADMEVEAEAEAEAEAEESPVAAATFIDGFNDNAIMSFDFEKESR